ncbi:MAG: hypothetical protein J6W76_02340, partial [Spirochaetales bacterium]|nr:hypothetical protein [Spirochaetales bacterium]
MKKALWGFIAVMALVMALSSCTPNGAPAGLIGEWTTDYSTILGTVKAYIDIRNDDTLWLKTGSSTYSKYADIKKCTCSE